MNPIHAAASTMKRPGTTRSANVPAATRNRENDLGDGVGREANQNGHAGITGNHFPGSDLRGHRDGSRMSVGESCHRGSCDQRRSRRNQVRKAAAATSTRESMAASSNADLKLKASPAFTGASGCFSEWLNAKSSP